MLFNNIINHLKLWCRSKAQSYQQVYQNHGGITYVGYQMAYELEFKLSTLIDKSFESIEDLKREVVGLIDVHY
ncbi:MAG: hypothetical protein IJ973_02505, partial [Christensenellaceae bacterium]|nr:hypothetical protein [Christensenellaceae bacterium]